MPDAFDERALKLFEDTYAGWGDEALLKQAWAASLREAREKALREAAEVARKASRQTRDDMKVSGPDEWRAGAMEAGYLIAAAIDTLREGT